MKKIIFKTVLFIIPLVVLAVVVDIKVTSALRTSRIGDFSVWNDLFNKNIKAEIVIYGSSRAWVHFNPEIIHEITGKEAYNLGINGHNFFMEYLRHQLLFSKNQAPKIILISLDYATLDKREDLYNLQQFLPYLDDSLVKRSTKYYKGLNVFDYEFPFVKYVGQKNLLIQAAKISLKPESNKADFNKGFQGQNLSWNNDFETIKNIKKQLRQHLDSNTISLFEKFIIETKRKGVCLVFVYSPEYIEAQSLFSNRKDIFNLYHQLSVKYGIPFLDYSSDSICYSKKFFYNSQHMNNLGATEFSKKLATQIKAEIQDSVATSKQKNLY